LRESLKGITTLLRFIQRNFKVENATEKCKGYDSAELNILLD